MYSSSFFELHTSDKAYVHPHYDSKCHINISVVSDSSYLYGNDLIIGPKLFKASFIGTAVE